MTQSEKQRHNGDEEIVKELCLANGVSYEKIPQDGSNITSLEMFFSGFSRMVGLSLFPRLCQLTVVGQSVSQIQGLEGCPLLRDLWVVECQLTDISALQTCRQLQKLYLYDNQISQIENVDSLVNLQVLWLNNNYITAIEGLDSLENLKELNLADNNIEKIGHSLDRNVNLQSLNLSGNKISSFKELTRLASLPRLRDLGLKEIRSSPNPVCLLCNYATHVLYHMPSLQRLDSLDVSGKQVKDAAESIVMKKMMYYSMRVRSAQRHLAETHSSLRERMKTLLVLPEERLRTLNNARKHLEFELAEVQAACRKSARPREEVPPLLAEGSGDRGETPADVAPGDLSLEEKILGKLEALKQRVELWSRTLERIEHCHQRKMSQATEKNQLMVQFLLMELETVGNIRFEEGSPADSWFTSCRDLLLSRFCASEYKPYGIAGVKIERIVRVHNRALRVRFEDKLHALLADEESAAFSQNYKRWLEYLFYAAGPGNGAEKDEVLNVLEDGFKSPEMYKSLGRDSCVPLSNSLIVTERPRIEHHQRQAAQDAAHALEHAQSYKRGQIVVSKVFLGRSLPVREGVAVQSSNYPKAHSVYRSVDPVNRTRGDESCSSDGHGGCKCSARQSQWFIFDRELVLPEYIIDFEYLTQENAQVRFPEPRDGALDGQPREEMELDEKVLHMEPVLKAKPKRLSLDEKGLLSVAKANVLSHITVLNLHGNSLSKLRDLSRLTALRRLTISFNEFTHLDDITHMPFLEYVDASYNRLVTLEGMRGLVRLKHLDLRWNQLTRAREEMAILSRHTAALLKLDIGHNPWHRPEAVRMTVLGRLTTLTHLDEVLVTEEEAAAAVQQAASSRINQASLLAHSWTDSERPRSLSLLSAAELLTRFSPSLSHGVPEPGWTAKITTVNLDGQRLSRLTNLDKLVNLRWASFNHNDISKMEGLDKCVLLEELSLNDNCISRLDGLSKLQRLTKLSLSGNQLSSLDVAVLDRLSNLHYLSVERNAIASLQGVQRLRSLFELCVGGNLITTTRDIYHLKALTNLIILDLYGNPLVEKLENYRIYVVFQLSSLKALDGLAVEVAECENAKDVFGGRLTPDMVAEKLGHSIYSDITDLTLVSCSIRTVDLAPADLFQKLRSVSLEHNNLSSFSGLVFLPNIKALSLNHNHIESILPRQKAPTHLTNRQILYHKVNSSGYGQQGSSKGNREASPGDSLEPLMSSLEVLHLSHNGISNMTNLQLSRLTNLKALFLQDNEISQVEGLEGLGGLRELVLDRNRIKALGETSFLGQAMLLELHVAENRFRDLNHFQHLSDLRRLFLDMNKLQEISELDKLEVLSSLIELSVVGNPVARRSLHRPVVVLHLSRLQILDGVTVTLEERTRAEFLCADGQYPGASGTALDVNLPGLQPLMTRMAPLRGTSLSAGFQHSLGRDVSPLPGNVEETMPPDHPKRKRLKHGSAASRGGQSEHTFRHTRVQVGSSLSNTALLPSGHRVVITYPHQDPDGRFQSSCPPKPPPM